VGYPRKPAVPSRLPPADTEAKKPKRA